MHGDAAGRPGDGPVWLETLGTVLFSHPYLVLSGNIQDLYPVETGGEVAFVAMERALRIELAGVGIDSIVTFDIVDGVGVYASPDAAQDSPLGLGVEGLDDTDASLEALVDLVRVVAASDQPMALLIRYASHLAPKDSMEFQHALVALDKLAQMPPPRDCDASGVPVRNPVFWLIDRPGDLPDWFVVGNHAVRHIPVDVPDLEERYAYCCTLAERFAEGATLTPEEHEAGLQQLALETDGMPLRGIAAVADIAGRQGLGLGQPRDAIRSYRTGSRRNPWASPLLLERLRRGTEILSERVRGQEHAVARTLQILTRSVLGLSGAQASSCLNRPRGVLFFAGPTGVGKTELAKSVTELLFGDESMCLRFDMTEFNSERSVARLIGAPPGYAGHEYGGELTNALRRRPFSVVLFDEVEKAHPRVLDMFLQVLDDGRLTDSRGETSYFTDALVIFTSNVGMLGTNTATNMGMEILPSDSYEALRRKLLEGIRKHFIRELQRPEMLNRIGQDIVAFNFIHHASATEIFDVTVRRALGVVQAELGIAVRLDPGVRQTLSDACLHSIMDGGRGIANRVESHLVNPLAEVLLDHLDAPSVVVTGIEEEAGEVRLRLLRD